MSLLFSAVTITPRQGVAVTIQESGHPDEYDLRELLRGETRYAPVRKPAFQGAAVQVCHYRFLVKGRDWLAERDSFALMAAYDKLAQRCGEKPFVQRKDVKLLEQYTISLDLCSLCAHRGMLTMADVGCCNCCDAGEFFDPAPPRGSTACEALKYAPIGSRDDALERIAGLGYGEFAVVSYEENWQRDQGEPGIEIIRDTEDAVDRFFNLCGQAVCVELRGIQPGGGETALCIGGTAPDLSEEGEYIEWPKPEQA